MKRPVLSDGCVCVCVWSLWLSYVLLLKTVISVISGSFGYLWLRYHGAVTVCGWHKLLQRLHPIYLSLSVMARPLNKCSVVLVSKHSSLYSWGFFFPNNTKGYFSICRHTDGEITCGFCWKGCFWRKCCFNGACIGALCSSEKIHFQFKTLYLYSMSFKNTKFLNRGKYFHKKTVKDSKNTQRKWTRQRPINSDPGLKTTE